MQVGEKRSRSTKTRTTEKNPQDFFLRLQI